MEEEIKQLEGKTISKIEFPSELEIIDNKGTNNEYKSTRRDDNIVITFTDRTVLKLSSWDYEGYSSGISKEVIKPTN